MRSIANWLKGPFLDRLAVLGFIVCVLIAIFWAIDERLHSLDRKILQAVVASGLYGERSDAKVVLVAIDERSIQRVGRWPWERQHISYLVSKLTGAGASSVGLNILFSGMTSEASDQSIGSAIAKNKNVVAAVTSADSEKSVWRHPEFSNSIGASQLGTIDLVKGENGEVVAVPGTRNGVGPAQAGQLQSFAVAVLGTAAIAPPGPENGFRIEYSGPRGTFTRVSAADIDSAVLGAAFKGKIVLVGLDIGLATMRTPVGDMSVDEVQANAIQTLIDQSSGSICRSLSLLMLLGLAALLCFSTIRLRWVILAMMVVAVAILALFPACRMHTPLVASMLIVFIGSIGRHGGRR